MEPPFRVQPELAWSHEFEGRIEQEPLTWDGMVLVTSRAGLRRTLHVLDLASGGERMSMSFDTPEPLEPSLWGRVVALRTGPDTLEAFQIGAQGLKPVWEYRGDGAVSGPLLLGQAVFAIVDGDLLRLSLVRPRAGPTWRLPGRFRGRPTVLNQVVYALDHTHATDPDLVAVDRRTGEVLRRYAAWPASDRSSSDPAFIQRAPDDILLVAMAGSVVMGRTGDVRPDIEFTCRGLAVSLIESDKVAPATVFSFFEHIVCPAAYRGGWVGLTFSPSAQSGWRRMDRELEFLRLLDIPGAGRLPAEEACDPLIQGDLLMIGNMAVDLAHDRVLWRLDVTPRLRPVPGRSHLLYVEGDGRLVAYRAALPSDERALASGAAVAGASVVTDVTVVMSDGSLRSGSLAYETDEWTFSTGEKASSEEVSLDAALLVVDRDDRPVWFRDARLAGQALLELADRALGERWMELAHESRSANDADLLTDLLWEVGERGVESPLLESLERRLAGFRKRAPRPAANRVKAVRKKEAALREVERRLPWDVFDRLMPDAPVELQLELLGAVLQRDPMHSDALAALRFRMPELLRGQVMEDVESAMRFSLTAARAGLSEQVPSEADAPDDESWPRSLVTWARSHWQPNLVVWESDELVVVAVPELMRSMTLAAASAHLLIRALDDLFRTEEVVDEARPPLVLFLCRSSAELISCAESLAGAPQYLDPEEICVYLPSIGVTCVVMEDDTPEYLPKPRYIARTLADHWLDVRCRRVPRGRFTEAAEDTPYPWLHAGFAGMAGEIELDQDRWNWQMLVASGSLDVVAHASNEELLPWAEVLGHTNPRNPLSAWKPVDPSLGWSLLPRSVTRRSVMFRHQATAAWLYLLHGDRGRWRTRVLNMLVDSLTEGALVDPVEKTFGMGAAQLGEKVQAFAREVTRPR